MLENWDKVQEMTNSDAAKIIFQNFQDHKCFVEETKNIEFLAEHMIEVCQFLKRKKEERSAKSGIPAKLNTAIPNSRFWYEVKKKINEIMGEKIIQRKVSIEESEEDSPFISSAQELYKSRKVSDSSVGSDISSVSSKEAFC